jgi:hypothetical protein
LREVTPPFSPEATVREFAKTLNGFGLSTCTSDRYAGSWPVEAFEKVGISVTPSERTKSQIYQDALPIIMSGSCELLDHAKLVKQLGNLERRTARGGKDSIDHPPRAHDDVANAAAGAIVLVAHPSMPQFCTWGDGEYEQSAPLPPVNSPEWITREIERKNREATATMFRMIGKTSPLL